jgi:hypothetical protein
MTVTATAHAGDRPGDAVFRPALRQLAAAFGAFVAVTAIASFSMLDPPANNQLLMALLAISCLVDPLRLARSSVTVGDRVLEIRGLLTTVIVDLTASSEAVVVPKVTRIVVRRRDGDWFLLPRWLGTPAAVLTEINRRLPSVRS